MKYPRNDDEAKTSVYTQTKNIYDLLTATIDDKNKGGIIYDEGEVVNGWNSFLIMDRQQCLFQFLHMHKEKETIQM